jgi:protein-disulfide isomerase
MISETIFSTFLAVVFMLFSIAGASAEDSMSDANKKEVEAVVEDFILKNPEILMRAIQTYQAKIQAEKRQQAKKNLANLTSELNLNPSSPVLGNPDGDITIVEFFDYRCGYCKRVFPIIQALLKEDGNIRYVLKELPILGPDSLFASQAALAIWDTTPEKYLSFHGALMASRGNLTAEKVLTVAENLAFDMDALIKSMKNKSVSDELSKNIELSERLNISGTPAFIVGNQLYPGALSMDEIKKLVALARKG